jgi:amino acid adenylation domain-containing protein
MIELPLSPAQERLWFLDRFDPGQPNNIAFARRLRGGVAVDLLAQAFSLVTERHAALRATFVERDGVPAQLIAEAAPFSLEQTDLSGEPASLRAERAREIGLQLFDTRFDLARGPLLRAALLRLDTDDEVLVVVAHHIIFDGSSQAILLADLALAYGSLREGTAGGVAQPFSPLPVGWPEYVREQADQPPGKAEQDLAYWRERLADPPTLTLPTDLPRPLFKIPRTERLRHDMDRGLADSLERLARSQRCTMFMLLLSAYQVLLGRHAGQEDVCVGSASAGRSRPELEALVGCFVHTLVLRGDLSGDPTVSELLRRTRSAALDAYAHQEIMFERLVSELDVARDVSRTPLFETMFILHTQDRPQLDILPGVRGESFAVGVTQTLYDIVFDVWLSPTGLGVTARYDSGLFTPETIATFARRYETLLRSMVDDPGQRISELVMEDVTSQRQAAARGQGPRRQHSSTADALFAARAAAAPDALAVNEMTYGELDQRANRIARHLMARGVTPGSVVGVCLDRDPDLVATLLAVWRCGAAYLPLDTGLPAPRMAWLREDAGASHLVTRDPRGDDGQIISLAEDAGQIAGYSSAAIDLAIGPASLAYVLYTSGSTGKPKGVGVPQAALVNLLLAMRESLGSGASDVWLGLTSLSFDISGLELYLPLVTGARLVLIGEEHTRDGVAISRAVREQGVTHVQATPSGWRMLLDAGFHAPAVTALTGGEALPSRLARELKPRVSRLFNVYGPTETTIWSTIAEVRDPAATISLGAPIANTQLYVVDGALRPVPVGVPGELLIGGSGVAWGYLGRPGLTAGRFVPDPYGPPGSRLYRTGDRVRWLRSGGLEFLGRADAQVKLRGYRIELGEIEASLTEHPGVGQAAAIVAGEGSDARLIGYVTAAPGQSPQGREVKAYLAGLLPAYLVPAQIVVLEALPLNTAGKIDRRNLPVAQAGDLEVREFVEARTDTEQLVAAVWSEVLGRERVGALDDFFDIGGHSLLATRVVSRISATLGLEVPIRALFLHSSVESFAAAVEELLVAEVAQLSDAEVAALLGENA